MKRLLSCVLVWGMALAGCSTPSLNALSTSDAAATDTALQGTWVCDNGDLRMQAIVVERPGPRYDTELTVWHRGKEKTRLGLDARLVRVGERLYADLSLGAQERSDLSARYGGLVLPAHQFARYDREGDAIIVRMPDPAWLERAIARDGLAHQRVALDGGESIVLTALPGELQALLAERGEEAGAFGAPFCFRRAAR